MAPERGTGNEQPGTNLNLRPLGLLAVLVLIGILLFSRYSVPERSSNSEDVPPASSADSAVSAAATRTLQYIDTYQRAPEGYEGGRTFHNLGDGGRRPLPTLDADGRPIRYQEWDIHPKRAGRNRGAERLITGSDGSAYYTADHYRTFTKIR
jgi:guanyl-specific ribonuclease Sa